MPLIATLKAKYLVWIYFENDINRLVDNKIISDKDLIKRNHLNTTLLKGSNT